MPIAVLMALSLFAGACIGVQGAVNGVLSRSVGSPITAALISFAAGIVALGLAFTAFVGPSGLAPSWRDLPVGFYLAGGILGAVFITAAAYLIPRVGITVYFALAIAGQLGAGLLLDHLGAFGLERHEVSIGRVAAVGCVLLGAVLLRVL